MLYVISWSKGKDSSATVELMHMHEKEILKPGDRVILLTAEIMFDKTKNIPAENPLIAKWSEEVAEPLFRSYGYEIVKVRSPKDYLDIFYHRTGSGKVKVSIPEHDGKFVGFCSSAKCQIRRDLKVKPLNQYQRSIKEPWVSVQGIAIDEPDRLETLHNGGGISLLERYGYTEQMAYDLCAERGLLSPQYFLDSMYSAETCGQGKLYRGGCWVCQQAKLAEHMAISEIYPESWARFVSLEDETNVVYASWNNQTHETLHERDSKIWALRNGTA